MSESTRSADMNAAHGFGGMHIPQPRVEAYVSVLVVDFQSVARLQARGV